MSITTRVQSYGYMCNASKFSTGRIDIHSYISKLWERFTKLYSSGVRGVLRSNRLCKRAKAPAFMMHRPHVRRSRQQINTVTLLLAAANVSLHVSGEFTNTCKCLRTHELPPSAHPAVREKTDNIFYRVIHGRLVNYYDETYSCGESAPTGRIMRKGYLDGRLFRDK